MEKDLIFTTSNDVLSIRYDAINGWLRQIVEGTKQVPHRDPKLAARGETEATGEKRLVDQIVLLVSNAKPIHLGPKETVEFGRFIEERVRPEVWKVDKPGEPKYMLLDPVGGSA